MGVEYFIGRRYLRAKQKQSLISIITYLSVAGVTVGVMALIVVIAVMAGMVNEMKSQVVNAVPHITLGCGFTFSDYRDVADKVEKTPGVESAAPYIGIQAMLSASDTSYAIIKGIDPQAAGRAITYLDVDPLLENSRNRRDDSSVMPGIILGKYLASSLGIVEGDSVQLISPRGSLSPIGHIPSMKQFKVVGIFDSGYYIYNRSAGYISLESAQSIRRMGDEVDGIEIRVTNLYKAETIRERIVETLGGPYYAIDWMHTTEYQSIFRALKLEKAVMFIILTLIVLVASFNIASSLIMMVMEKKKDIAILRAMGATSKQIRRIFVFKGMVVGLIGTLLGGCLGTILCSLLERYHFIKLPPDVYGIDTLPVKWEALDVMMISVSALIICFAATLYPAHQASRLNPVEAIRNE